MINAPTSQPEETIRRNAINPKASVWVSANAGSGKTTILTRRVISLLLSGVDPSKILCLTYTRAAAAEMQNRVFEELSRWVRLEQETLSQALFEIEGRLPDTKRLAFARRLFARAVETPGGLKVQTIHAFCERLLHLFPFEANVPASFRLMDEVEQSDILENCIANLQNQLISDKGTDFALNIARVTNEAGEYGFASLVREALKWRGAIADYARDSKGNERSALAAKLGLGEEETETTLTHSIAFGQPKNFATIQWEKELSEFKISDAKLGVKLDNAKKIMHAPQRTDAFIDSLLTAKLTVPTFPPTKDVKSTKPDLYNLLKNEQIRIQPLSQKLLAARCYERTCALMNVADEVMALYAQAKRQRGLLDFDDVIRRTNLLLLRSSSAWVLYKLDGGIDHLLVDEAQDTSPEQWSILTQLTNEFYSGDAMHNATRTVFAVGDEKQSIYSFQGAKPDSFAVQKKLFAKKAEHIQQPFHAIELQLSFRSTGDILSAVDATFATPANYKGLSGDDPKATVHETTRIGEAGLVEIWPAEEPELNDELDPHAEVDATPESAPDIKLAKRIAARIAFWLKSGARFDNTQENDKSKRISAGDIIILVRKRSVFFNAMIRALKAANVPVAGADRLKLTDHIAVQDLLSVAEVALLPDDDLTLANVLKSPLIGLNDDDLIALAANRGDMSLWEALNQYSNNIADPSPALWAPSLARGEGFLNLAYTRILHWRMLAQTADPFTFFSTILAAEGGRKRMLARLGTDAAEAMDVFLNDALSWQTKNVASLFQFISFYRSTNREVKREFENTPDSVRVMTVHASKGLEARIVFLADTFSAPNGTKTPKLFKLQQVDEARAIPEIVAWSASKAEDPPEILKAREHLIEAELDEYRRLLYVGMTRARDRLYIAGFVGKKKPSEAAWFSVVQNALGAGQHLKQQPAEDDSGDIWQWRSVGNAQVGSRDTVPSDDTDKKQDNFALPEWLNTPLPHEARAIPPLRPSSPLHAADWVSTAQVESTAQAQRRGILVHMLLQHLGDVSHDKRAVLADRLLALKAADLPHDEREIMRNQVCDVLQKPEMQMLFGSHSRAEVEISGALIPNQPIMARIDRLAVLETEVLIVDFKTGKPQADIPEPMLRQLSLYKALVQRIYPDKHVRAGIIWVQNASIMFALDEALDLSNLYS